jgi:hypothetical protein
MVSTLSRGRTDREVPICTFSSIKPAKPLPLTRLGLRSLIAALGRMILNYSVCITFRKLAMSSLTGRFTLSLASGSATRD